MKWTGEPTKVTEEVVVPVQCAVRLRQIENCWAVPLWIEYLADVVEAVEHMKDLQLDEVFVCPWDWQCLHR